VIFDILDALFFEQFDDLVDAAPEQGLSSERGDEIRLFYFALLIQDGEGDRLLRHDFAATRRQFDDRQPV